MIHAKHLVHFLRSSTDAQVSCSDTDFEVERLAHVEDGDPKALCWYRGNEPAPSKPLGVVVTRGEIPKALARVTVSHPKPTWLLREIIERYFSRDLRLEKGDGCTIHPSAQLCGDGQTYLYEDGSWMPFPHCGGLRIGDNVNIGALTSIMRGSIGDTVIGAGSMIGSQVNIGHDTRIGERVLIIAGARLAGWVRVEDGARVNQGALIKNGVRIGEGAQVGMGAVVLGDVPAREVWVGNPARKLRDVS